MRSISWLRTPSLCGGCVSARALCGLFLGVDLWRIELKLSSESVRDAIALSGKRSASFTRRGALFADGTKTPKVFVERIVDALFTPGLSLNPVLADDATTKVRSNKAVDDDVVAAVWALGVGPGLFGTDGRTDYLIERLPDVASHLRFNETVLVFGLPMRLLEKDVFELFRGHLEDQAQIKVLTQIRCLWFVFRLRQRGYCGCSSLLWLFFLSHTSFVARVLHCLVRR